MSNEPTLESIVSGVQSNIKALYGVEIEAEKCKGLAFLTLKKLGKVSEKDKYKTYEHISKVQEIFSSTLGQEVLSWEDLEHLTGNMFFSMRSLTGKSVKEISSLIEEYRSKESLEASLVINDLTILANKLRGLINEAWKYQEKTQQSGAGLVLGKIIRFITLSKDGK